MVSSAYVSGRRDGRIEERPTSAPGFNNSYEASKWLAEREALGRRALPVNVVRPSIIVGDANDGSVRNFTTLYYPFRLVAEDRLRYLPGLPDACLDIVPANWVARVILTLHERAYGPHMVVHACAGENVITPSEIWVLARRTFEHLAPLPTARRPVRVVPTKLVLRLARVGSMLPGSGGVALRNLKLFVPYLTMRRQFVTERLAQFGVGPAPHLEEYSQNICGYALERRFVSAGRRVTAQGPEKPIVVPVATAVGAQGP